MLHNGTLSLPKKQPLIKTGLVVEDDVSIAEFLALAISSETPHAVLLVANGREALETLKEITPDLILLDYHLPEMDGLAFYDLLRSVKGQEETPVVFLSASTALNVVEAIEHRNVALLAKPFELTDLLDVIQQTFAES